MYFHRINIWQWLNSYHLRVFSLLSVEFKPTFFFSDKENIAVGLAGGILDSI